MGKLDVLTGKTFGRLTVTGHSHKNVRGEHYWFCRCECGNERAILGGSLRIGATTSCGCVFREAHTTHGMTKTRTFKSWDSMRQRCLNENDPSFARYGGRGISVCARWRDDFAAFLKDMGERPAGKTLDRIDGRGDYSPDNCRWASYKDQVRNRQCTQVLTVDGVAKPLQEWCEITGLKPTTILSRLAAGWPEAKVLAPARSKRPNGFGRRLKLEP
jgi:hypothetical protein